MNEGIQVKKDQTMEPTVGNALDRELKSYLSRDEIQRFVKKSNFHALRVLLTTWLAIFSIFGMVYIFPNPLTIVAALFLLAGRQLGLSIVMHESGHKTFFESRKLNDFFGQWFAANPLMQDLHSYAKGHLKHHQLAGTNEDPDLKNYKSFPVEKSGFKRKVIRDLSGQTGWKLLKLILKASKMGFSSDPKEREFAKPFLQEWLVQLILFVILSITMSPFLYLLWVASWMTTYMLIVRLRQIAEHAAVEDLYDSDPRKNTRTVVPNIFERIFVAPNYVNYHLEHHFLASVPCYNLKALHELLKERGAYDETKIAYGYREVFQEALI